MIKCISKYMSNCIFYYIVIILIIIFLFLVSKSLKIEGLETDNVTVVSGYWKVKNKYNEETYKNWFKNSLNINQKYIFFCDNKEKDFIKEFRKYETEYIDYPLDNFYSKQFAKDEWVHPMHSPSKELAMIWNEKIHLIKLAKDRDPNPTEYYIWIDAGIPPYRDKSPPPVRLNINKELPKNKLYYSWVEDIIAGGVLIIHRDIIDDFHDKYYDMLQKCNDGWECGMEQKILARMLHAYPDLFYKLSEGYGQNLIELYNYIG